MDLRLFKFCFRASRTGNAIYASVPKAGCTTVQMTLANDYARTCGLEPLSNPHTPLKTEYFFLFKGAERKPLWDLLSTRFLFSIVRNPYSRLLSAYLDKICHKTKEYHYFLRLHGLPENSEIDFSMFVDLVSQETEDKMDQHWAPQHRIIAWDLFRYDYIGFQESFHDDLQNCLSRGGIPTSSLNSFLKHSQSASSKLAAFYNEELCSRVYAVYRRDFELFGYSPDIANILPDRAVVEAGMKRASRINPLYEGLITAHDELSRGDAQSAAVHLDRWLASADQEIVDGNDHRFAGQVYLKVGRFAESRLAFQKALSDHPDSSSVLMGSARCAHKMGNYQEALEYAARIPSHSRNAPSAAKLIQKATVRANRLRQRRASAQETHL